MRKHYRVVSIPRIVTFIVLCTVLMLATVHTVGGFYRANHSDASKTSGHSVVESANTDLYNADYYTEITVSPGDTLWSIARDYYGSRVDKRKAVYEIQNTNHLTGTALYAGQLILLPKNL